MDTSEPIRLNTPPPVPLLDIKDLTVEFSTRRGIVKAVQHINIAVAKGETLAIVGESGSGKSVTSLAIMGLHPTTAKITGSITLHGEELLSRSDESLSKIRGESLSMIFQDPLSALTPVYSIGDQIVEAIQVHHDMSKAAATKRAVELLDLVGIPNPDVRVKSFPHEFSGGEVEAQSPYGFDRPGLAREGDVQVFHLQHRA